MTHTISSFHGDYVFLSNFYSKSIFYRGAWYLNSEAAYQAQKVLREVDKKLFRDLSGRDAKRLGRKVTVRNDWEEIRVQVMREVLRAKFTVPEMRDMLLATGEAKLEEGNTWGDRFWGTVDGQGENWLGRLLMETRASLRWETKP